MTRATPKKSPPARAGAHPGSGCIPKPAGEKFIRMSITMPSEVRASATALADRGNHPSFSAYLADLVRADANAEDTPALLRSETSLEHLVERLAPGMKRQLSEALAARDIDQSAFLTHLLAAAVAHLKAGGAADRTLSISPAGK